MLKIILVTMNTTFFEIYIKENDKRKCDSRYRVRVIGFPQNQIMTALYGYRVVRTALCGV